MALAIRAQRNQAAGDKSSAVVVTFALPLPPSTNRIWRYGRGKVFRSKEYQDWLVEAGWEATAAKVPSIKGPFRFDLFVSTSSRIDCDNHLKAVLDFCEGMKIVENDRLAMSVHAWRDAEVAPGHCLITIRSEKP